MTTQLFLKSFFLLTALVALTLPQGCGDDDPVDDPASNTNTEPQPTPEPEPEPERHAIEFAPSFSGATDHSQIGVFAFDTSTKWDEWAQPTSCTTYGSKRMGAASGTTIRSCIGRRTDPSISRSWPMLLMQRHPTDFRSATHLMSELPFCATKCLRPPTVTPIFVLRLRFWISGIAKKRSGWSFDPSCRKSDSGSKDRVTRFRTSRCEVSSGRVKSH